MSEGFAVALALPQLAPLLILTFLSGMVYGFAGFGAALVFMPIASALIDPVLAIAAFALSALSSLFTLVPCAWGECDKTTTILMTLAATLTLPLGVWLLRVADPVLIRIAISALAALTLIVLIRGFRFSVRPGRTSSAAVAGAAGVMGGATGLLGPIVILFNLSSGDDARRIRANTLVFLTLGSLFVLPQMAAQGVLAPLAIWLGILMLPAYAFGGLAGRALFNPERERLYRAVAYAMIALSIVMGLPIFG